MIDVRIVCTYDGAPLADALTRLLEAEEHRVRVTYGRQALNELEEARGARDAVLLIWSPNARSQTYMLEWARNIQPSRLVEIARDTTDWPTVKRLAAVIDFTNWRGQRGARAWKALNERLSAIARSYEPRTLPIRPLIAASAAGMAAAVGALMVGAHTTPEEQITPTPFEEAALFDPADGVGGPLVATEPASLDEDAFRLLHIRQLDAIEPTPFEPLADLPEIQQYALRDQTLLERLSEYNPLRRESGEPDR